MSEKLEFELVSPERLLVSGQVEMVVVPGSEGDFGALPRHAPMITTLRPGIIDVYQGGKIQDSIFVAGGFAEVTETRLTVLAEEATKLAEITPEAVAERVKEAMAAVEAAKDDHARRGAERALLVAQAMKDARAR
jgi:F-type H+-transporting ATPase subunit epsilon